MHASLLERLTAPVRLVAFALLVLACCQPSQPTPPITPDPSNTFVPPTPLPTDTSPSPSASPASTLGPLCVQACKRLEALGCPEAQTPFAGKPCPILCTESEANGITLRPECVAKSITLDELRACGIVRCLR